jgi:hypothetical protein
MRLARGRRYVLKVSVIMQDDRAMMLSHRRGKQIDDASGSVVTSRGHANLDIAGALGDGFTNRQHHVEITAALGNCPNVADITTGVTRLQINGHTGRCGPVGDEAGDDIADWPHVAPRVSRSIDQVELTLAERNCHRRACRMTSASVMSGPTPKAYGSSSNCSMRRRRSATNPRAALTVSFLVVVPNSLAASAIASSSRSIIVFIYTSVLLRTSLRQYARTVSEGLTAEVSRGMGESSVCENAAESTAHRRRYSVTRIWRWLRSTPGCAAPEANSKQRSIKRGGVPLYSERNVTQSGSRATNWVAYSSS